MTDSSTESGCKCTGKIERIVVRVPGIQGPMGEVPLADKEFLSANRKATEEAAAAGAQSAKDAQDAQTASEAARDAARTSALDAAGSSATALMHAQEAQVAQEAAETARDAAKAAQVNAEAAQEAAAEARDAANVSETKVGELLSSTEAHAVAASASASSAAEKAAQAAHSAAEAADGATAADVARKASEAAQVASEKAKAGAESARADAVAAKVVSESMASAASGSASQASDKAAEASTSATAAAGSAETAKTAATESGVSAEAAKASQVAAIEAQEAAEAARDSASASSEAASTSAAKAAESQSSATTDAATASEKAASATLSAQSAEEARTAAQSAAQSASSDAATATQAASDASASKSSAAESAATAKASADKVAPLSASIEVVAENGEAVKAVASAANAVNTCAENIVALTAIGGTLNLSATAEEGDSVNVTRTVDDDGVKFNFTIPKGADGAQGAQGEKGDKGDKGDPGIDPASNIKFTGVPVFSGSSSTISDRSYSALFNRKIQVGDSNTTTFSGIVTYRSTTNAGLNAAGFYVNSDGRAKFVHKKGTYPGTDDSYLVFNKDGLFFGRDKNNTGKDPGDAAATMVITEEYRDTTPTSGSTNYVTSDGIYKAIEAAKTAVDLTEYAKLGQMNNGLFQVAGGLYGQSLFVDKAQIDSSGIILNNGSFTVLKNYSTGEYDMALGTGMIRFSATRTDDIPELNITAGTQTGNLKLTSTGAISVGDAYLVKSVNGVAADSTGNVVLSTSSSEGASGEYLPLSGGTLTGELIAEQGVKLKKGFTLDETIDSYDFGFDWSAGVGPGFAMRSSSYTGSGDGPGCFIFWARKDKNSQVKLIGSPNGTLSWNGVNVDCCTVKKNSSSDSTWYRTHLDGFIEMGGIADAQGLVTFPKSFNNVPVVSITIQMTDDSYNTDQTAMVQINNVSTTGFRILCGTSNAKFHWIARGF